MSESPRTERKIPLAACDRGIRATECLVWHIQGRAPGAVMGSSGLSIRLLCPNHPDIKPSLVISVGQNAPLVWHCHVCGKEKRLEVRYKLIEKYRIEPKCLPMTKQERVEQEEMVFAVFASSLQAATKLVCIRAIHEGLRGPLPRGKVLVRLGERASVSERSAYRAGDEAAGASLDHLFIAAANRASQAPQVTPAMRDSTSLPDWQQLPNRQRNDCQFGSDATYPNNAA